MTVRSSKYITIIMFILLALVWGIRVHEKLWIVFVAKYILYFVRVDGYRGVGVHMNVESVLCGKTHFIVHDFLDVFLRHRAKHERIRFVTGGVNGRVYSKIAGFQIKSLLTRFSSVVETLRPIIEFLFLLFAFFEFNYFVIHARLLVIHVNSSVNSDLLEKGILFAFGSLHAHVVVTNTHHSFTARFYIVGI